MDLGAPEGVPVYHTGVTGLNAHWGWSEVGYGNLVVQAKAYSFYYTPPRMPYSPRYDRYGGMVRLTSGDVLLGITPVPGGGTQHQARAIYGWPVWNTGERDVTVVIATSTPTPTQTLKPTSFFSVETALGSVPYSYG